MLKQIKEIVRIKHNLKLDFSCLGLLFLKYFHYCKFMFQPISHLNEVNILSLFCKQILWLFQGGLANTWCTVSVGVVTVNRTVCRAVSGQKRVVVLRVRSLLIGWLCRIPYLCMSPVTSLHWILLAGGRRLDCCHIDKNTNKLYQPSKLILVL